MIIQVSNTYQLLRAYDTAKNGDVIVIFPGTYLVTPQPASCASYPQYGGAALTLIHKENVTVMGLGFPVIQSTRHGSIFSFYECNNCSISGVWTKGNGYITSPTGSGCFAGILMTRSPFLRVTDNIVDDSGDQGISELHMDGPEGSDHVVIARNLIRRCGFINAPAPFYGDGAAIAVGSSDMDIYDNVGLDCFRGCEIENSNPNNKTCRNRILRNRFERSLSQGIVVIVEHGNADLFTDIEIAHNIIVGRGAPNPTYPQWGKNEHGIVLMGGKRIHVHHNHVENLNDWIGYELIATKSDLIDCDFESNTALNCGRGGFWNLSQGCVNSGHSFRFNRVNCPTGPGLTVSGSNCTFTENFVTQPTGLDPTTGKPWWKVKYNDSVLG
jgi:hypothetical protein